MKYLPQILQLVNVVVMVLLIIMIALQNKSSGLSTVFGGPSGITQTRRGFEKWLFYSTIILAVLFIGLSIANIFVIKK